MISPQMLTSRDRILLKIAVFIVGMALFYTSGLGPGVVLVGLVILVAVALLKAKGVTGDSPPPSAKRRRKPPGSGPSGGAPVLAPLLPRPVLSSGAARPFPPVED
jgi:hypothetical protein